MDASEDQMEMMLMMQMDKLHHDFHGTGNYSDTNEMPTMEFSPQGSCNNNYFPHHHQNSSSNFMNMPTSTISFTNTSSQLHQNPNFLTNPSTTNGTPFSSMNRTNMAAMREMIFRIAAMQPINIDPESVKPPKRRNVKISTDPQSVAARHRRERISERIRILQRLVPGGTKMDTASMLDEAIHYVKFLKSQVQTLERAGTNRQISNNVAATTGLGFPVPMSLSHHGNYNLSMSPHKNNNIQQYADA